MGTHCLSVCLGLGVATVALIGCRCDAADGLRPVPFTTVKVDDGFWVARHMVYRAQTIPHSWQYVQREIEDNEIAAGWLKAERGQDTPWNQANLHKVLETCAYAIAQQPDPELDAKLDYIISAIAGAQQPDGYVNALITVRDMTPWANLDGQHDGYVAGHLIEAAVAHHLATGEPSFIEVACRLADHIHDRFITQGHEGVGGHAELELALVRLYRVTGEARYLELAREWIERRGRPWAYSSDTPRAYFMDHLPIREAPELTGHAVRTMFYLTGVAGVASEMGDDSLAEAARRLWRSTTERKMYVTGSVGSQPENEGFGPDYELPNDGYCESCAACGLAYFAHEMFLLDGRSGSIDVLERVLYNAALHGISLDGTTTYYRNPLTDAEHPRDNCWVCCPPCLSRTLLRVPDYIYARTDRQLYVNLYVGGAVTLSLGDRMLTVSQTTDYPWSGHVRIAVDPDSPVRFPLHLRVPGWARSATVAVNGKPLKYPTPIDGYVFLDRKWRAGDTVDLEFPMPVERLTAHPSVEADRGLVALQRGPLVYGFEALDNEGSLDITLPEDAAFQPEPRPDLLGGVTALAGTASDGRRLVAVPFYSLANRGLSSQIVWVRQAGLAVDNAGWEGRLYRPLPLAAARGE